MCVCGRIPLTQFGDGVCAHVVSLWAAHGGVSGESSTRSQREPYFSAEAAGRRGGSEKL